MVFIRKVSFVWRQLEFAFFGAPTSVGALFDYKEKHTMEKLIFDFKSSVGDGLKVYEDRIVITHSGFLNFLAMGIKGDKTIYYSDLTAVQFKKGGWTAGHIQFSLLGGRESVGGVLAAASDENTITINDRENEIAEKMVAYIQNKIKEAKSPKAVSTSDSAADEIMKLKNLLDMGIITQEEFDAKKKQLLGL